MWTEGRPDFMVCPCPPIRGVTVGGSRGEAILKTWKSRFFEKRTIKMGVV